MYGARFFRRSRRNYYKSLFIKLIQFFARGSKLHPFLSPLLFIYQFSCSFSPLRIIPLPLRIEKKIVHHDPIKLVPPQRCHPTHRVRPSSTTTWKIKADESDHATFDNRGPIKLQSRVACRKGMSFPWAVIRGFRGLLRLSARASVYFRLPFRRLDVSEVEGRKSLKNLRGGF